MDLGLTDKRVLVTGGTRGIGRATVEAFLDEGAHVAFCARDAEAVIAAEQQFASRPGRAVGTSVDVGNGEALRTWVESSAATLGGIDVVVSNVSALAIPETEEGWVRSFEVDLMGAVRLVGAARSHLEASGAGAIVAVSSVSGREIDFAAGPYGTMKAALVHYIAGLAYQLAPANVRANVVSPGNTFFAGGVWDEMQTANPELYSMALDLNPTGRMGTPQEMASAIVFLASPVSSFTSGTNLVVDGALTRGVQL